MPQSLALVVPMGWHKAVGGLKEACMAPLTSQSQSVPAKASVSPSYIPLTLSSTFKTPVEALHAAERMLSRAQALRSLETGLDGWSLPRGWKRMTRQQLEYGLRVPNPERMLVLKQVRLPTPRRAW